ncbi:MAG: Asp-tRNA(Asn)/Glu-tRNA(Gln) amidotransferase subunit GatC [Phycisphaeraceae bacterium]|nr:Asp-tRNA(Asn)/Glu-tRNA(Gln) amidotransferase subunit GatC [Phycisphaeraceae bacterium]
MAHEPSAQHVRAVARLSRLAAGDAEVERLRRDLGAILGYVERLRELDLSGVEPMASPLDMTARPAPDEPGPALPTDTLVAMAPASQGPFVRIPKVTGGGGGA